MGDLEKIMQVKDEAERLIKLEHYGRKIGISYARMINMHTGKPEENMLVERIQQALSIRQGQRMWIIALCSAIASIISAVAAWTAVFLK